MGISFEPRLDSLEEKVRTLEHVQRATLNILEDFDAERNRLQEVQRATLNILEDFEGEKRGFEDIQRGTLNILEDFDAEKRRLEESQRALLNILEDFEVEKGRVAAANQELDATNKELEAFTYSVSHDLRAPLRHVDGFAQLLVEDHSAELSDEPRRYLTRIREGARQMGQLVDDLLHLSRLGRRELSLQTTGLNSLVGDVIAGLKRDNPERRIEWKIEPLPFVDCDPSLMKQVFANLLSNAVKYTRPRERAVIEVGTLSRDGAPIIFVRDNGVGFSMKYASKLFGVFQRLHRPEDFEGTGVGLAAVQRIIHKHAGRIWAEAELEKGATFYFSLETAGDSAQKKLSGVENVIYAGTGSRDFAG